MATPHDGSARPRTAAPSTGDSERERWSDDDYDSEEDPGMFAFLPPQSAGSEGTPSSPATTVPFPPGTAASTVPYSPDMFNRALNSPSGGAPPSSAAGLSPAAAYARAAKKGTIPRTAMSNETYLEESEHEHEHEPIQIGLMDDERRTSGTSSGQSDKMKQYAAGWDAQESNGQQPVYDFAREQAIRLQELGGAITPTRSEDEKMLAMHGMLNGGYEGMYGFGEDEDSPYPEVRASVSNMDDPEMPCLTFRTFFLGTFFAIVITAVNVFFYFRYPAPFVTPILVQIVSYPCGKFLAYTLPATTVRLPAWMTRAGFGNEASLNPGPFNIKEHTLLVIIANIATGPALALSFSVAAEIFYEVNLGAGFDVLLLMTTQMIGFGVAGLCRRFLVWPAAMIWPQNLVFCTLLNTLHAEDDTDGTGVTRHRFFIWVFSGAFFWYFLPGFLFQALSVFSFVCWAAPNNVVVNQLFGLNTGLGMSLLTFDWSQIAYIGSPLVVPWWAEVNVFVGFVIAFWIIAPALYYSNIWDVAYLPISASSVFDRFGATYDTSLVIDPVRKVLNVTAYEEYSPLYLPVTYATSYGVAFMLATSIIVHTALYHGPDMWNSIKNIKQDEEDVHMKLMKNYPEVPDWWYWIFLVISVGLSITTVAAFDTQMPVWGVVVALIIGFIYILPGGFIFAMTSTAISVNLIVELVGGYIMPGAPLANMLFKTYSAQCVGVGLSFVQDLKFGHYMKIPPRVVFTVQICSTFIAAMVQVGVKRWLVGNVTDFCELHQSASLICPGTRVFYSASIIWGLIGPQRQFGIGQMYNPLLWWLLVGAVAPVFTWLLTQRYPKTWVRLINIPVALNGAFFMPPATGINFASWFIVGFIFQYLMRRVSFQWWSKFNFVLSAGLDAGTITSTIFIFLTLMLPKGGTIFVDWWGNNVFTKTADYQGLPYLTPPEEGFGRTTW